MKVNFLFFLLPLLVTVSCGTVHNIGALDALHKKDEAFLESKKTQYTLFNGLRYVGQMYKVYMRPIKSGPFRIYDPTAYSLSFAWLTAVELPLTLAGDCITAPFLFLRPVYASFE